MPSSKSSSSLFAMLTDQLGGDTLGQLSRSLGADEGATAKAVAGALPLLLGALERNAAKPEGAAALASALDRDHDGSALSDLMGLVQRGGGTDGTKMLGHIFGGRQAKVENGLGQMSGLDLSKIGPLLATLAPMVLGTLGKAKRQGNVASGGLSDLLRGERREVERRSPFSVESLGKQFLDQDGDGDIMDDVARMGGGLLGKLFKG